MAVYNCNTYISCTILGYQSLIIVINDFTRLRSARNVYNNYEDYNNNLLLNVITKEKINWNYINFDESIICDLCIYCI